MYFPALERLPSFLVSSLVTLTFPLGSIIRLQGKAVTLEPAQKSCKKKEKGRGSGFVHFQSCCHPEGDFNHHFGCI